MHNQAWKEIDNNIGKVQSNSPLNIKHEHENHFNFLNSSLPCNHVNVLVDASSGPLCFLLANFLLCLRLAPIPAGTLKSTRVWVARLPLASVPTHVHTHKNKRLIQLFRYLDIQLFSYLVIQGLEDLIDRWEGQRYYQQDKMVMCI